MKRIVLHVERLTLRGVDRADVAKVSAALRAELQGLLAQPGATLVTQGSVHTLHADPARLPSGADATALGRALAGRIAGSRTA